MRPNPTAQQTPRGPSRPSTHSVFWGMFFYPFSRQLQTSLARADEIEMQREKDSKEFDQHVNESIQRLEALAADNSKSSATPAAR